MNEMCWTWEWNKFDAGLNEQKELFVILFIADIFIS